MYNQRRGMVVRGRVVSKLWIPSPLSRSLFGFVMKKSPQSEGTFIALEIKAPGWRCHPGVLATDVNLTNPHSRCGDCTAVIVGSDFRKYSYFGVIVITRREHTLKVSSMKTRISVYQTIFCCSRN